MRKDIGILALNIILLKIHMKNLIVLTFIFSTAITISSAQKTEEANKKDISDILPGKGDWGIGVSATPIFKYVGNLFNYDENTNVPGLAFTAQYPGSIYFKYVLNDKIRLRTIFTVGYTNNVDKITNNVDENNPHLYSSAALNIGCIVGLERMKSIKGRLLSFYGFQAGFQKDPFVNGNIQGKIEFDDKNDNNNDYIEEGGNTFVYKAGVFTGLEFYILPRIALTGEIGIDFGYHNQEKRTRKLGTDEPVIVNSGEYGLNIKPITSGDLSIFIYF